jgi:hypothetical protein
LATQQKQVALGTPRHALNYIEQNFPSFIETYTWRDLCREWLIGASSHEEMSTPLEDVGGAWTTKHAIDVVGINRREKRLVLGTCRWASELADQHILRHLITEASYFVPKRDQWTIDMLGFSADGWTAEAKSLALEIKRIGEFGKNWRVVDCRLLDLESVYADLARWKPAANGTA